MDEVVRIADEVRAQAERSEAAAFDRQYELARRAERAVEAMAAAGRARAREWADDDRRDEADRRFDPEPEDREPPPAAPAPSRGSAPADDDEEDGPTTWLR